MSTIESLSELVIWDEYKDFTKERLKQLPSGDSPFLVSKAKVDFKVGGSVWKGFVVMIGTKGASTAKLLKKEGVQFREGKCQVQGTELVVGDLDIPAVKAAADTLKKLHLGFTIAGVADTEEPKAPGGTDEEAGGTPDPAEAKIEERRQELLAEIAEAEKLNDPANKEVIAQAKKVADGVPVAVSKKQYETAEKLLDGLEGLLGQLMEGPAPAPGDDPDLPGLDDWKAYRTFMKAQVRRLTKEGPAFISREKVNFTIEGKPFVSHAILVGQKGHMLVQILRRAGTQFMEGTARLDGTLLRVGGLKMMLLKGAAKTMARLRAGCKIVPEGSLPPDEDEDADDATLDPLGKKSLDKEIQAVAESLDKLGEALETQKKSIAALQKDAEDKKKAVDTATKKAEASGKGEDWKAVTKATEAAEAAKFTAKRAGTDADRAAEEFRGFTERLHRIRDNAEPEKAKLEALKKLKADVAGRRLDLAIVNIDPNDPKAGKIIADQIKKRFGVSLDLYQSKITGRDDKGEQVVDDTNKKADLKKEAATLKELYITLSRAPVFPSTHLKKLKISLRPSDSESEGGVYYEKSKTVEVTCKRPSESMNYGNQLNSPHYFPDGVDENCQAANSDPVDYFSWATLHEVAHAVDAKHKFMDTNGGGAKYGTWVDYGGNVGPVATVVADQFGSSLAAPEKTKLKNYAQSLMQGAAVADPATPEETAVKDWVDSVRVGKGIWWDGAACNARAIGKRVYQEAYDGWWNSYSLDARKQGIHGYQFRARGEWFAELYAAYYSDKLKPSHPFAPDLVKLEQPK